MSDALRNRSVRLRRRPSDLDDEPGLELVEEPVPDIADGQALVATSHLSVDPTSRVFISDLKGYLPRVAIGDVVRGLRVGRVVTSRRDDLPLGAAVLGWTGWQDYCVADDAVLETPFTVLPDPLPAPPEALLGVLGHTGITAWLAVEIADPADDDTVVVSAAAGAVGSVAGQLAKERGARVVGIAGGREKCRYVTEQLGFDACVDRRAADWRDQLDAATPNGIDVDIEHSGGEILDHVLSRLNVGARVALSGMIADYSADRSRRHGLQNLVQVVQQRATITGLLVLDHAHRFEEILGELGARVGSGTLIHRTTVVDGLENAEEALARLFNGDNVGKVVVRVSPQRR